ncbi:hypothetical protein GMJAKD_12255 [Candidatus Electrothrix aarhusensis]
MISVAPKITCVIPTYQRAAFLYRAVSSVLVQTFQDVQVKVFDNASQDETENVVQQLANNDSRVCYYRHEKNIGAILNFKAAVSSVTTKYFSILSDDDLLEKEFYEKALNVLEDNHDLMFVTLDTLVIDEKCNLVMTPKHPPNGVLTLYKDENRFDALHSDGIPCWTGIVFRKEAVELYVDMSHKNELALDYKFLVRMAARYPYAHLSQIGAFFTIHSGSTSFNWDNFDIALRYAGGIRYLEVINDRAVSPFIRDRAIYYLKRYARPQYRKWMLQALRRYLASCCNDAKEKTIESEKDIVSCRKYGYIKSAKLLAFLYEHSFFIILVRFFLLRYYKKKKNIQKQKLEKLHRNAYRDVLQQLQKKD